MQIYKRIIIYSFLFIETFFAFSQALDMPQMPSMPEVLSMPEISSPTVDGSFYTPSVPTIPKKPEVEKTKMEKGADTVTKKTITESTSPESVLSSLLTNNTALTAQDISSLYDYGLFSDISSLNTNTQNVSTNVILNQILSSLDELKKEQKNVSSSEKESLNKIKEDSQVFKSKEPSILRFKIDGYDMIGSLTTVFFSDTEPDGTFLLTADRKYSANQKIRNETFYILFKAKKTSGGSTSYDVIPSIVQDYTNENSFIYKLTQQKNLEAGKTGNLVVMHFSGDINIDLLLNLDN